MTYGYPFRFAFKYEFNSPAKVLIYWTMKINISAANCLTVDTVWFDRLLKLEGREHEIK